MENFYSKDSVFELDVVKQEEKYNSFKERLSEFEGIETLEEAINLAKKILPVNNEITRFNVGNANITIVNRKDNLRISLDSDKEFISYDFV